ncbi:Ig domain-containing protein [Ideonella livida]|uniref:Uncharacterized protein n=1 Tax=Ideonella livida TaxID=2707176 RepID=A0A7C9PKH1_9BURK|nr:Ig domain-containing protein [Ideonella livida]NDY94069.1 hypothetical protein [Ideonella livida]
MISSAGCGWRGRWARGAVCALALPWVLVGCGGSGSGGDLAVDFAYPEGYAYLFRPASLALQAVGLQGNTPNCTVVEGALPAGLSLQPRGCLIAGTPTQVQVAFVTVRLTVAGFSGQVDKSVRLEVVGPALNYPFMPVTVVGSALSYLPSSSAPGTWTPQDGETVVYSLSTGALPEGLALNAQTGEISGLLVRAGAGAFGVSAQVSGPLGTATSSSQALTVPVGAGGLQFFYGPNDTQVVAEVGSALALSPLFNFGATLEGSRYTRTHFRLATGAPALPAGLTLDPVTGVLSGTVPNTPGELALGPFAADLSAEGRTATFTSSTLRLFVPTPTP